MLLICLLWHERFARPLARSEPKPAALHRFPRSDRHQPGNPDQIICDQVEQEVSRNPRDPAMLGLAHRAVLLAPAENALDHRAAGLRHAVTAMPRGAAIDGAMPPLAGLSFGVVARHMRRHSRFAQRGHMLGSIIGLVLARCDAPPAKPFRSIRSTPIGGTRARQGQLPNLSAPMLRPWSITDRAVTVSRGTCSEVP